MEILYMNKIKKNQYFILKLLIFVFLLFDIAYSFYQYFGEPIDGDVPNIVSPAPIYEKVLKDPLGLSILNGGEKYAATNRFSCHWMMRIWFTNVHHFFSLLFRDKINCLFFTAAFFSIVVQYFIIALLSIYITKEFKFWKLSFLFSCLILASFFQSNGFDTQIGIIDHCITYTFFYAFPLALLMLYFLPFFLIENRIWNANSFLIKVLVVWMIPFSLFLAFSGPLIAPLVLLICPSIMIYFLSKNILIARSKNSLIISRKDDFVFPNYLILPFSFFIFICLYSFYLGTFNIENGEYISLFKRYQLLMIGLPKYFFSKLGLPIVFLFLGINFIISKKIIPTFKVSKSTFFICFIALVYLLILPLGGYRSYRPYIVRYDTFLPITILLLFFIGKGSLFVIENLNGFQQKTYLLFLLLFLSVFLIVDKPQFDKNECQRINLKIISERKENVVVINSNCTLLSWILIADPAWGTNISDMLFKWKITDKRKEFVNR